ncbi:Transcription factor spt8 [Arachnomyces sp. PD_36]|nr:Transcription factor spt8 [Arachnomyces sp. PD_36]
MEEDDDRDVAGSQDGSSDNDVDETMRDAEEAEADGEPDPDPDPDPESPSNGSQVSESGGGATQQNANVLLTAPPESSADNNPTLSVRPDVRAEALSASTYDIVPTTAAPHSTSINAICSTADMRWVFSGGSDGFVRKFNWADSINSKLMLTVAQRHPFVDSVVKAGVLMTYWENMDGNALSPVYSLASQSQGLWILSGLESGSIRLQSVRHDEGKEIAVLQSHTSAVSVLNLTPDEKSLLSGSWDKRVLDWDLNVGQPRRTFVSSTGQVSAIEMRPESTVPIPQEVEEAALPNGTFSTNNHIGGSSGYSLMNGANVQGQEASGSGADQPPASPADSLFATDSLFGDADGGMGETEAPSGGAFEVDEDDEFTRALANGRPAINEDVQGDSEMPNQSNGALGLDTSLPAIHPPEAGIPEPSSAPQPMDGTTEPLMNGLPHAEDTETAADQIKSEASQYTEPNASATDTVFLAASIDGIIRVWDRRQQDPVARILPRHSPPWCMNACWSPDGSHIYAGRRNGTVEEFSLHKGFREPERTFRFPQGSGPVTAVRPMPNGRHLICASYDILRLYDLKAEQTSRHSTVPFLIVPGHRTGVISQLYIDSACRYMISTGGNRGWEGATTEVLLGYEIGVPGA